MKKAILSSVLSPRELALWSGSSALILIAFLLFDRQSYLTLAASLVGVTSLIFTARGNPLGQLLMVIFSALYGIISFAQAYYGEMITYLGMTAPMAVAALVSWLRHPAPGQRTQVQVGRLRRGEPAFALALTAAVTGIFYFILRAMGTANLVPSTISVTTSFLAAYLTFRRSEFFALAYAANDVVLIIMWGMAAAEDNSCLSVAMCFAAFLCNDLYGFASWRRMRAAQRE